MNLRARAALLDSFLVYNTKEGERQNIIVKADDAPEWVTDVVYAVHGDSLPDDWTYKAIKEAASAIEEDGEDAEIEADIYTRDLLEWLTNASGAADYCDEATSEYGAADSIIATIQQGQAYAYAAIVSATIAALTDTDTDIDEEEEEEEEIRPCSECGKDGLTEDDMYTEAGRPMCIDCLLEWSREQNRETA